jgi:L-threonylcarbamoyladenylate synthase
MDSNTLLKIETAARTLQKGGIIAYPTEAVYGLGCDPFNVDAVAHLLQLKQRSIKKGFILIAANWQQVTHLVEPIDPKALARVFTTWPGPVTWVFPATVEVPFWVRGDHKSIAIRISAHPIVHALCEQFGKPIISTSANLTGSPSIRDEKTIQMVFGDKIDFIVSGQVGPAQRPTTIRDAISGETLRAS